MSIAQAHVCPTEHGLDVKGVQKVLRKLDAGEETLKPVFFKFEYFDRRLMHEMECYASRRRKCSYQADITVLPANLRLRLLSCETERL